MLTLGKHGNVVADVVNFCPIFRSHSLEHVQLCSKALMVIFFMVKSAAIPCHSHSSAAVIVQRCQVMEDQTGIFLEGRLKETGAKT